MQTEPLYRASERALLTELGDGTGVLLDLDSKFYFTLNDTAIYVWKLLTARSSLSRDELVSELSREYAVEADAARADLDSVLETLSRERLILVSLKELSPKELSSKAP